MAWVLLLLAGLFEIAFTTALRYTEGLSRPLPLLAFVVFASISLYLLMKAAETIPLGTSYAVWTGIGAAGTALAGIFYFGEPATTLRLLFLTALIGSIVGLKLVS
jgi:quaternary ammonium compound-resistance protein SugE